MTTIEALFVGNLLHIGFGVAAIAYLLRDILWLRLIAATSYAIFTVVAVRRGADAIWQFVPWYAAFIAINLVHAALLTYQRWLWRFTADEIALHANAFPMLALRPAKLLMRSGRWQTRADGEHLTREGELARRLYLIAAGRVEVTLQGRQIVELVPGQFVGEIGFIARQPASATATVKMEYDGTAPRFLVWETQKLRRQLDRDDELRSAFESALGTDLARKLADQNIAIRRQPGSTCSPTSSTASPELCSVSTSSPAPHSASPEPFPAASFSQDASTVPSQESPRCPVGQSASSRRV